ncbi:DUF6318 family protein [Actinotalea subterranea]|uniref:DUF6318 family protein n=1 Tax=Actinotalea subterranea TaxID=2607497 RepID=UPI0011EDACFC|nr:DUF6318 family protein [Actinotalea subterranea]
MRRGKLGLTFAVLAVMLTVGCTGQAGDPPTTEPPSPSVTPSPTPTPTPTPEAAIPPERPDMSQVDDATAEAVATYFLELYPYVYATRDLTEWRALSHPECEFCASVVSNVEEMSANGNRADGGILTVRDVAVAELTTGHFSVTASATQDAGHEYDTKGNVISASEPGDYALTVVVLAQGGSWTVRGVDFETSVA